MQNNVWKINKTEDKKQEQEETDEYKPDMRFKKLLESLEENKRQQRHKKFQNWLNKSYNYSDNEVYVEDILNNLCKDVFQLVKRNGYTISNEKQLRNEIATFVYKESDA